MPLCGNDASQRVTPVTTIRGATGFRVPAAAVACRDVPWLRRYRIQIALYFIGVAVFAAVSGNRITQQSADPHFVYQAEAWLHGRLDIASPQKGDDWAKLETVVLDDGSQVRGRRMQSRPVFRVAGGGEIPLSRVRNSQGMTAYVSFPPFPAVLLLPQVLVSGRAANDVVFTVLLAGLVLPLLFSVLDRLRRTLLLGGNTPPRSVGEQLWLVACFAFGSVFFFSAVRGEVWFTAHVVGVVLALIYANAAIDARRPIVAGLALGCAAITRTPMAFMFPLFVLEAWRAIDGTAAWQRGERSLAMRAFMRKLIPFAIPVIAIAVVAMIYNAKRFGSPTEFGHSYLDVRQQAQMESFGLFSYKYFARNLAVAFTLLPELPGKAPWVTISGHGLAMWFTTPVLFVLLWPRTHGGLHRNLWLTVAFVAVPTFFYQNSGWFQFGYRFSLDYLPFLIILLAVGNRPLGRVSKLLIVVGIAINLFGAVTFGRSMQFYRMGGDAYPVVVAH